MMIHRELLVTRMVRLLILVAAAALAIGILAGISQSKAIGADKLPSPRAVTMPAWPS